MKTFIFLKRTCNEGHITRALCFLWFFSYWRKQRVEETDNGQEPSKWRVYGDDSELLMFNLLQFMHLGLCKSGDIPRHAISNGVVPFLIWRLSINMENSDFLQWESNISLLPCIVVQIYIVLQNTELYFKFQSRQPLRKYIKLSCLSPKNQI